MPVAHRKNPTPTPSGWPAVSRVEIDRLFGRYSYSDLNFRKGEDDVAILYGDNGVGKTTILKLIYGCLSPSTTEHNRTYLSQTPFSRLLITLMDGSQIEVRKDEMKLVGSYTFRSGDYEQHVQAKNNGVVTLEDNPKIDEISAQLRQKNLDLLFIGDDRTIRSSYEIFRTLQLRRESREQREFDLFVERTSGVSRRRLEEIERTHTVNLSQVIEAVGEWLSRKTRQRASSGDENASNVYLSVVKALSAHGEAGSARQMTRRSLLDQLAELNSSVPRYQKFGLIGTYPLPDFMKIVQDAPEHRIPDIAGVLSPYLDSLVTRLNALEEVQLVMSTFEDELDSYLRDKHVGLHVDHELRFFDDTETNISTGHLSSGERQLVFLFCAALMSRDGYSLFIIDEPELSLNVKWQRRLVSSLSRLASGAATQFIMATHSIEILTQHRRSVIELN